MLKWLISKARRRRRGFGRPRVVIGVPSGITQVEKRAVRDSALCTRGPTRSTSSASPRPRPSAPACPSMSPAATSSWTSGARTEVAVISLSGTVYCNSVRVAGDEMDESIVQYIKKHYNLLVGERRAEEIKIALGSACPTGWRRAHHGGQGRGPDRRHPQVRRHQGRRDPRGASGDGRDRRRDAAHRAGADSPARRRHHPEGVVLRRWRVASGIDQLAAARADLPVRVANDPLPASRWERDGCSRTSIS